MKKVLMVGVVVAIVLAALLALQAQAPVEKAADAHAALPASLAKFYPPSAPAPVYLIEMHNLSNPLTGMMSDLFQGDMENVQKNFDAFKQQYSKLAAMVPEWSALYPMEPVTNLGEALKGGDQQKIMAAVQQVGQTCSGCHHRYLPAAQYAYHWGDFSAITATDPLSKADVDFKQLMMMLATSMGGVGNDLMQGQIDNARQQAAGFEARYNALAQTCSACHDTDRKYFVDPAITDMISSLKGMLAAEEADPQAIGGMLQKIGEESCMKCHLVHIPAAYAKAPAARS